MFDLTFDPGIWCPKWNIWKPNLNRMGLKIEILSMLSELRSKLKETDKNNSCKMIQHVHVKYTGFSLTEKNLFRSTVNVDKFFWGFKVNFCFSHFHEKKWISPQLILCWKFLCWILFSSVILWNLVLTFVYFITNIMIFWTSLRKLMAFHVVENPIWSKF